MPITHRNHDIYAHKQQEAHKWDAVNTVVHNVINKFKTLPLAEKKEFIADIKQAAAVQNLYIYEPKETPNAETISSLKILSKDKLATVTTILEKNLETEEHICGVLASDQGEEK